MGRCDHATSCVTQTLRPLSWAANSKRDLLAGIMLLLATFARAQEASVPSIPGQSRSAANEQLQEIIVTAQKRAERIQDIPISVTAISGADLQAQGISGLEDATRGIPGVAQTSAGPGQTQYTIRGLSSSGPAVSTVGFYLDDVPMTAPSSAENGHVVVDPDLYDLNRVEVLRGPQGTLYGSGSMGGTIKIVTNQADLDKFSFSAKVDGSTTSGGGRNGDINGMINIPIVDGKLALRIVGTDQRTSGWIDRVVLTDFPLPSGSQCAPFVGCTRGNVLAGPVLADYHNVNDEDLKSIRASVRLQATEEFSVALGAFYQTISQGGLNYFDNPPGTLAHYEPFDIAEPFADTFRLYNLVLDYDSAAVDVTSATSYWTRLQSQIQDTSETIQSAFGFPTFDVAGGGVGAVAWNALDRTKQFSQEIRLTSKDSGAWRWLVGGFYSDYDFAENQFSNADGFVPQFGSSNVFNALFANNMKQKALFGETSYKFATGLKATLGLRWYSYTQAGKTTDSGIAVGVDTPVTTVVNAKNSGVNPKFTLSYEGVQDLLLYTTAAKGFRPGAGNGAIPVSGPDSCLSDLQALGKNASPSQYGPDSVWNYEIGEKANLWDKRLTVNSAIYYERWTKVQQGIVLPCGFGFIDNVGTNTVRGAELEIEAKLSPSWTVQQSAGYTHGTISSTVPGSGLASGEKLLNVPTYTANTAVVYTRPINDRYSIVARASNTLVGPSEDLTFFLNKLPGYDIAHFRVGVTQANWSAFLFVDNVANKHAFLSNTTNYALNIPSLNRVATNQPRTIGLTLEVKH
jgi:outer membrane receptor protein involved in Fe transport